MLRVIVRRFGRLWCRLLLLPAETRRSSTGRIAVYSACRPLLTMKLLGLLALLCPGDVCHAAERVAFARTTGLVNGLLFSGRQLDKETALYFYRTRYLHPSTGRFSARDRKGTWGDLRSSGSAYAYVASRPNTAGDPFGRDIIENEPPPGSETKGTFGLTPEEVHYFSTHPEAVTIVGDPDFSTWIRGALKVHAFSWRAGHFRQATSKRPSEKCCDCPDDEPDMEACVREGKFCADWGLGNPPGFQCYRQLGGHKHCCYQHRRLPRDHPWGSHIDWFNPATGQDASGRCKYNPVSGALHLIIDTIPSYLPVWGRHLTELSEGLYNLGKDVERAIGTEIRFGLMSRDPYEYIGIGKWGREWER